MRRSRQQTQAETRERIIDAAEAVFTRSGFGAASVEEIAEGAGYSHGAVYSNFAGKEALFFAVYEERIARRQREIQSAASQAPPNARDRAAADQWMRRVANDPDYFLLFLEFVIHAGRDPAARALRDAHRGHPANHRAAAAPTRRSSRRRPGAG